MLYLMVEAMIQKERMDAWVIGEGRIVGAHPEPWGGIGSNLHAEEGADLYKIKDSAAVHDGNGGRQAQRETGG